MADEGRVRLGRQVPHALASDGHQLSGGTISTGRPACSASCCETLVSKIFFMPVRLEPITITGVELVGNADFPVALASSPRGSASNPAERAISAPRPAIRRASALVQLLEGGAGHEGRGRGEALRRRHPGDDVDDDGAAVTKQGGAAASIARTASGESS